MKRGVPIIRFVGATLKGILDSLERNNNKSGRGPEERDEVKRSESSLVGVKADYVIELPTKQRTRKIISLLKKEYPDAHCALIHSNPLELLIATILSAQCTDKRVNIVTADLFRKYRTAEDYIQVAQTELEKDIRSTGFYRNKAKSIQGACRILSETYKGQVPKTLDELLALPGVARKTANVVLGTAFGITSGIVVDTHVSRLSQRLDLSQEKQPEKIERDLMELVPRKDWILFSHLLIWHGRAICHARTPLCEECVVEKLCPSSRLRAGNGEKKTVKVAK